MRCAAAFDEVTQAFAVDGDAPDALAEDLALRQLALQIARLARAVAVLLRERPAQKVREEHGDVVPHERVDHDALEPRHLTPKADPCMGIEKSAKGH